MAMKELQDFPKIPSELMERLTNLIIIIIMIISLFRVGLTGSFKQINSNH